MCIWDEGKGVMLETIWQIHEALCLLLPFKTARRVWEMENIMPLSHPYFITHLLCQGGAINFTKRVYMCPAVFMHILLPCKRRYSCACGIAHGRVDGVGLFSKKNLCEKKSTYQKSHLFMWFSKCIKIFENSCYY